MPNGSCLTCYFLLNYAAKGVNQQGCENRWYDLLFSFELCTYAASAGKQPSTSSATCYFLLNYASRGDCEGLGRVESWCRKHPYLLFSFELCFRDMDVELAFTLSLYACYFLLNYARPSNFHNSTIFLRPLLAIFFWIMRGKGSKGQAAGVGGSPVSLLAIFFWIMPWKAWLLWLRLGTKTCYFLLNYAWTRTNRWRLPVQTGLLFSFELCHCCYCLPWSPLHRVSCYFLLNYA